VTTSPPRTIHKILRLGKGRTADNAEPNLFKQLALEPGALLDALLGFRKGFLLLPS
jgi:hypothetical protein